MRASALALSGVFFLVVSACSEPEAPVIVPEEAPPPRVVPDRAEAVHFPGMKVPLDETAPELRVACEPGEMAFCTPGGGRQKTCRQGMTGMFYWDNASCNTPLVVSFDDRQVAFTKPAGSFTIGESPRTEWVSSRNPWLALDRDGSGCIDDQSELFGSPVQGGKNGFDKLAVYDENHDGWIDAADGVYSKLVLWFDRDQNRRCTPGELVGLADAGLVSIELGYATPDEVPAGSHEGEHATIWVRRPNGELRHGRIIDVYLASLP
jgi:hypothetical protein